MSGLVQFRPERISGVTDSVPEQLRPDRMITSQNDLEYYHAHFTVE